MFITQPLDYLPLWALALLTLAVVLLALEVGYRLGRHRGQRPAAEIHVQVVANRMQFVLRDLFVDREHAIAQHVVTGGNHHQHTVVAQLQQIDLIEGLAESITGLDVPYPAPFGLALGVALLLKQKFVPLKPAPETNRP